MHTKILVRKPEGKRPLGYLSGVGRILKWIINKMMRMWTRFIWHRAYTSGGFL
jgi:hypothetical protein